MRSPDLAPLAAYVARHDRSRYVIWLGADGAAFPRLAKEFIVLGADRPDRAASLFARPGGTWIPHDFEAAPLIVTDRSADNATVVCNDLVANEAARPHVFRTLANLVSRGATALVTAPGPGSGRRDALRPEAFVSLLVDAGLPPTFAGLTATDDATFDKTTLLAIVNAESRRPQPWRTPPEAFKVVAVITAFNEADVIEDVLEHLFAQNVLVHFIDNWSTDDTVERVSRYLGRGVVAVERFPLDDTATFDLERILLRLEQLSSVLDADWIVHYDADEIRRSPFKGVDLRRALYAVDRCGYNVVDFTVMNFRPTDDSFAPGMSLERHFSHFEFGTGDGHLRQRKAWKNLGRPVYLTERAGHDVLFGGRNVFPYKFMNKHYPVQSQAHGERKLVRERYDRFNRRERRLRQWHLHYERVATVENFLVDPDTLHAFDAETFYDEYLVERLTGIGSLREPDFVEAFLDHHGESI